MGSNDRIFNVSPNSIIDPRPIEQWFGLSFEASAGPYSWSMGYGTGTKGLYGDVTLDPTTCAVSDE